MHIFLVSDSKTGLNFFPQLEAILRKKIAGLDLDSIFVPFPEDIPAVVSGLEKEADLIFVFVLYEELDFKIKALLDKLIEIDMRSSTRIVKAVEEKDLPSEALLLEGERDRLAEKWSKFVLNLLFKPDSFKPGQQ